MVVVLDTASSHMRFVQAFDLTELPPVLIDRSFAGWRYLIVSLGTGVARIWIDDSSAGPFVILLGSGKEAMLRSVAAQELIGMTAGGRQWPFPMLRPKPNEGRLLTLMLSILDAVEAGQRPREIACTILYPKLEKLRGPTWTSAPERRQTYRMIHRAIAIRDGGYRVLLRGRMPKV